MNPIMPVENVIPKEEDKSTQHLSSLLPLDSYIILFDLFIQFMSNKLAIGRVLVHGPITLSEGSEADASLFDDYYKTLRDLITQYRRDLKGDILKKFTAVTSFSHSYEAYFDFLVKDINALKENAESKDYEASLGVYLKRVQAFRDSKKNKAETNVIMRLEKVQQELNSLYEAFCKLTPNLAKEESKPSEEALQATDSHLQAIAAQLAAIDEKYLQVVAFSDVGGALQTRTVAAGNERTKLVVCDTEKVTQFYENQSEQTLASLGEDNKVVKQAVELNLLIAAWSKNLVALLAAMKKTDTFWLEVEKNLSQLGQFIAENKADEAAIEVVVKRLEADRDYFGVLGEFAKQLEMRTTAEVTNNEPNSSSLELNFLFKEVIHTSS
jgi:hypothetical protein